MGVDALCIMELVAACAPSTDAVWSMRLLSCIKNKPMITMHGDALSKVPQLTIAKNSTM